MAIREQRIRIAGYFIVACTFFLFFMLEMFFSWQDEYMLLKTTGITVVWSLAIWEVTRYVILALRKRYRSLKQVKRRTFTAMCILVPYSIFVGVTRIWIEDSSNLWGVHVGTITNYSVSSGISLLFVLLQIAVYEGLYFFHEWNKARKEAEDLKRLHFQMQFDALKLQIQPHFLFNTFSTLISLITVDPPRAKVFTEKLSSTYRYFLEASEREMISLEEELRFARTYFYLLQTRFENGLHLHIEDTPGLDNYRIPPLSLQLLLENAIKHNVITCSRPLHIRISIDAIRQRITVTNNLQPKQTTAPSGKGLQHLKKRFALMAMEGVSIQEPAASNEFRVTLPFLPSRELEPAG
ncbi:sensor histidine kinase [Chitinophaga horti]|uniref:Sensor histidine kinase n=1 Tax=Chitinophaga horti TaxID=2920382 RepID=A0ABY6J3W7_9BACT|nr:sensor histidine kinase [Chitinophaga horti]UYQ94317.1 sensor histidine kinase [Chitinophaga horti]